MEIYRQEGFFTGPRIGVDYQSVLDLSHIAGSFGDLYPTLASTPIIENSLVRSCHGAEVAGGGHTLWTPSRSEASIRSILAATGLINTSAIHGYQWCLIYCNVLSARYPRYSLDLPSTPHPETVTSKFRVRFPTTDARILVVTV